MIAIGLILIVFGVIAWHLLGVQTHVDKASDGWAVIPIVSGVFCFFVALVKFLWIYAY